MPTVPHWVGANGPYVGISTLGTTGGTYTGGYTGVVGSAGAVGSVAALVSVGVVAGTSGMG